jgi:EAL domain-containing protein (putative c-di-GMP-specific phosphodiesterase class I)
MQSRQLMPTLATETGWYLFGCVEPGQTLTRIPINSASFVIGRRPKLDLTLCSPRVSGRHAEILVAGEHLFIRDLGSKNGTYVNRARVNQLTPIGEGDHVELADMEFRVEFCPTQVRAVNHRGQYNETAAEMDALESAWVLTQFDELIQTRAVTPHYQAIIAILSSTTVGYEALARSPLAGMENPRMMFETAELVHREIELSLLCRYQAVSVGRQLPKGSRIFLNTHPAESLQVDVLPSVRLLRDSSPEHNLVVELHEAAIDDLSCVHRFIGELKELGVGIAYDDFGAGRSRLLELIQAPPDFLKFDLCLIRGIDRAPAPQRRMLQTLVDMVHEMGTGAIAEGVETREEAQCCRDLGFDYLQGYFFGRPQPVERYSDNGPGSACRMAADAIETLSYYTGNR